MQISTTPDGPRTKKGGPPACYLERYAVRLFPLHLPFVYISQIIWKHFASLDVAIRIVFNSAIYLFRDSRFALVADLKSKTRNDYI